MAHSEEMTGNVMHMLGKLEGLITALTQRLDADSAARLREVEIIHKRLDDHGKRIGDLETDKSEQRGMVGAAKLIVPLVWGLVLTFGGLVVWLLSGELPKIMSAFGGS